MNKQQAKIRIENLKKEINHHRYLYHVLDKIEISDAALDSLKHELAELEKQYPNLITPDSPTQRVGGEPLDEFKKVKHRQPILSLQDAFSFEEFLDWEKRNAKLVYPERPRATLSEQSEPRRSRGGVEGVGNQKFSYFAELKLDGLAIILRYKDGVFEKGITRGNGMVGEDVTRNLKTIESIPLRLAADGGKAANALHGIFEARGEVVMTKKAFEKVNREQKQKGETTFANPRNTAAGSIRQLDSKIAASRDLDCTVFEILTDLGQETHQEVHEILKKLGFKVSPYTKICPDFKAVQKFLAAWEKKRQNLPYQTDGAVMVVNDIAREKKLGSVGKAERWMIAYKFPAEQATTMVEEIKVQVGRTGALTPVAHLKPVRLAGSTICRATLHNQDEIERLDIRVKDTVIIQKAGDIIPDVVKVLPKLRTGKEKKFFMPKNCPVCSAKIIKKAGEVNYYCSSKTCGARRREQMYYFVSKKAFDIDGLGPRIIDQLLDAGLIQDSADFFLLKENDLKSLERFEEKSSQNLVAAIGASKKIHLSRFIIALGIRHVGEETAIDLADHFGALDNLSEASLEDINNIYEIGEVVAKSVYHYFQEEKNKAFIRRLLKGGVKIQNPKRLLKNKEIEGKTFVLTGALSGMTREQAKQKIRQAGGDISSSVSEKTDYVIAGIDPGSKYEKAKFLGVKIISEAEFLKLLW